MTDFVRIVQAITLAKVSDIVTNLSIFSKDGEVAEARTGFDNFLRTSHD